MEELDITQLFNYFKSKIIYIIFATSIFFCLSSIYVNKFRVPKYTSETTILLNQANENSAINTSDINIYIISMTPDRKYEPRSSPLTI